jgi:hypothetical protein
VPGKTMSGKARAGRDPLLRRLARKRARTTSPPQPFNTYSLAHWPIPTIPGKSGPHPPPSASHIPLPLFPRPQGHRPPQPAVPPSILRHQTCINRRLLPFRLLLSPASPRPHLQFCSTACLATPIRTSLSVFIATRTAWTIGYTPAGSAIVVKRQRAEWTITEHRSSWKFGTRQGNPLAIIYRRPSSTALRTTIAIEPVESATGPIHLSLTAFGDIFLVHFRRSFGLFWRIPLLDTFFSTASIS